MLQVTFPQYSNVSINVFLFNFVSNAKEIRQHLLAGDSNYNYAFIEAKNILSLKHLEAAIYRAVNDLELHQKMKTKTIHSEVILSLCPSNNIREALTEFGISNSSTSLYIVRVNTDTVQSSDSIDALEGALKSIVEGSEVPPTPANVRRVCDLTSVEKRYGSVDEMTIISAIAMRGY